MNKKCIIHNGRFSYILIVDQHNIPFQGSSSADYFEDLYKSFGYEVERTGNGQSDYSEYIRNLAINKNIG